MLIQHVQEPPSRHLSCPMHRKKAPRRIKRRWEPGGAACRQKMHMGKVCKGERDVECAGDLLYPSVALP
ncbi:MAG: hypothetical protein DUD39_04260 [Coriobacteriaceae bacterium]|nr:MAG: hypothetical protein DUD39_04260 [Coriobacteriaceae bacterium]